MHNLVSLNTTALQQPIFVVGTPRSGTTLVANILGGHPDIFAPAPGESHFFQDIWSRRNQLGQEDDPQTLSRAADRVMDIFIRWDNKEVQKLVDEHITKDELLKQTYELGGGFGALYYAFTRMLAQSQGKTRYCDDTPKHLFYLHDILNFYPKAKVIGCTRDPRDFLCSYKHYWRKAVDQERIKSLYHPIITSLLWYGSTNLLRQHLTECCRGKIHLVKYEQLVINPQKEVRQLCDFVVIDFYDELLQINSQNSSFDDSGTQEAGIFTTAIGRWEDCLTKAEAWYAQNLNKSNMRELGYTTAQLSPSKTELLRILAETPIAFWGALEANRAKRGPLLEYIARRLISLAK